VAKNDTRKESDRVPGYRGDGKLTTQSGKVISKRKKKC